MQLGLGGFGGAQAILLPWLLRGAGAVEGLKSLKQARLTDPVTGLSWGVVRVYADPSTTQQTLPYAKRSQSPAPSVVAGKPEQQHGVAVGIKPPAKPAEGKPGQVCVNCGRWCWQVGATSNLKLSQAPWLGSMGGVASHLRVAAEWHPGFHSQPWERHGSFRNSWGRLKTESWYGNIAKRMLWERLW